MASSVKSERCASPATPKRRAPTTAPFPSMDELRTWVTRPQAVTRCTVGDVYRMRVVVGLDKGEGGAGDRKERGGAGKARWRARDVFMLDQWPCRMVEIVGWVAGVDQKEKEMIIHLDSGEHYMPVLPVYLRLTPVVLTPRLRPSTASASGSSFRPHRPTGAPSSVPQKTYPRPDVRAGDTLRVRGRIEEYFRRSRQLSSHGVPEGENDGNWVRQISVEEGSGGWVRTVYPEEEHAHLGEVQVLREEVYGKAFELEEAIKMFSPGDGGTARKGKQADERGAVDPVTPRKRKKGGVWDTSHDWTRPGLHARVGTAVSSAMAVSPGQSIKRGEPCVAWSSPVRSVISETSTIHSLGVEEDETLAASPSFSASSAASLSDEQGRDGHAPIRPRLRDPALLPPSLLTDVTFRRYLLDWMVGTLEDALDYVETQEGRAGVDRVIGEMVPEYKGLMRDVGLEVKVLKQMRGTSRAAHEVPIDTPAEDPTMKLVEKRAETPSPTRSRSRPHTRMNGRALSENGRENTSSTSSISIDSDPSTPTKPKIAVKVEAAVELVDGREVVEGRRRLFRSKEERMRDAAARSQASQVSHKISDSDLKTPRASSGVGAPSNAQGSSRRLFRTKEERMRAAASSSQGEQAMPIIKLEPDATPSSRTKSTTNGAGRRTFRSREERMRDAQSAAAPTKPSLPPDAALAASPDPPETWSGGPVIPIPVFMSSALFTQSSHTISTPSSDLIYPFSDPITPATRGWSFLPAFPPPSLRTLATLIVHRTARTEERRRLRRLAAGAPRAADLEVERMREARGRKRGDYRLDEAEVGRRIERLGRWALREIGKEGGVVDLPSLRAGSASSRRDGCAKGSDGRVRDSGDEPTFLPLTPALLAPVTHFLLLRLYRQAVFRRSRVFRKKGEPVDPRVKEGEIVRALREWGDGRWERAGEWGVRDGLKRAEERGWAKKVGEGGDWEGWVMVEP